MRNFIVVFVTCICLAHLFACGNANISGPNSENAQRESADPSSHVLGDVLRNAGYSDDVLVMADVIQDDSITANESEEQEEPSQLPSDPTENPDQESSYYEFPAWHIPAPPK